MADLPLTSSHVGLKVTATWKTGSTTSGTVTRLHPDGSGFTLQQPNGAYVPIPHEGLASVRLAEAYRAPAHDINAAITTLTRRRPFTSLDDALVTLLETLRGRHLHQDETAESVAMCTCGDEWVCDDIAAALALCAVIVEEDGRG